MNIFGIIAALIGFGVSLYLLQKRTSQTKLMCPRKGGCDRVVSSTQGTLLGIHNDVLGSFFYASVLILIPLSSFDVVSLLVLQGMVWAGFLYSIYLVLVQLFVIRAWCLWCSISALAATGLFFSIF